MTSTLRGVALGVFYPSIPGVLVQEALSHPQLGSLLRAANLLIIPKAV